MGRGFIALLAAAVLAGLAASQAFAATTHNVDDDGLQCFGAPFTDIQSAVNAAVTGDTVRVCPGTYDESVTISTPGIIVRASSSHPDVSKCNGTRTNSNRTFVTGADPFPGDNVSDPGADSGPAFSLLASNIQLLNFVVEDVDGWLGIYVSPSTSGHLIQMNLVQDNEGGLYLNTSGASTTNVMKNCFRQNTLNPGAGYSENGIASDQGVKKVTISGNRFFDDPAAEILLTYVFGVTPAPSQVTVKGNILTGDPAGDGEGIAIFGSTGSVIQGNIITDMLNRGIFVGPRNSGLLVKSNIVRGPGIGIRIRNRAGDEGHDVGTPSNSRSTGLAVRNNIVQNARESGISVEDTALTSSTFLSNIVQGSGENGIGVETGNTSLTFMRNIVQNSGFDGVFVDSGATGLTLTKNIFQNSNQAGPDGGGFAFHDAHDANGPPTTNTWTKNICATQNQASLCLFGTTTPTGAH